MSIARTLFFLCLFCCHLFRIEYNRPHPDNVSLVEFVHPSLEQRTQSLVQHLSTPSVISRQHHNLCVLTPGLYLPLLPLCIRLLPGHPANPAWPRLVSSSVSGCLPDHHLYLRAAPPPACGHWPAILSYISRRASSTLRFHWDPTCLNLPGWVYKPHTHTNTHTHTHTHTLSLSLSLSLSRSRTHKRARGTYGASARSRPFWLPL